MINKKRIFQSLLVFLGFTFFVFILNWTSQSLNYDIIWCYHISQKIANGFELYADIGTVVTPIYFWIGSLFVKIFGNSIISMDIYAGVVSGAIATIIFNIIQETKCKENVYGNAIFVFYMLYSLAVVCITNYNTCAIMWVLLAAFLEVRKERKLELKIVSFTKKKEKAYNFLIGICLGLAFFTKQNIGAYGVLATGIFSLVYKCFIRKENTFREILLKASGFLSVLGLFILYFISKGTLGDFLNFCIGGLLEFGDKNLIIGMPIIYFAVITILTVCFALIGSNKENNVVWVAEIIYLLCMMLLVYPLTNEYHILCAIIMLISVYIMLLDKVAINRNLYISFVALFYVFIVVSSLEMGGSEHTQTEYIYGFEPMVMEPVLGLFYSLFVMSVAFSFVLKKEKIVWYVFALGMFIFSFAGIEAIGSYISQEKVPEGMEIYQNHGYKKETIEYMENVIKYILEKEAEGKKVYVVSADASYYMAALGRNQYKYDLNLYGSLGYNGEETLIEETKALGDVIILKDSFVMFQEPKKFDEFIKENYEAFDKVGNLIAYRMRD